VEFSNPDGQHLKLNIARPKQASGALPAILCIHGGGFRAGTREGYDGLCVKLAQQGYVAATVTYRLSPAYRFPAAVQDCKAAVRWLRANAASQHVDPARIGVMGASAGGHLALFLGVTAGVRMFEGEGNLDQSSDVSCVVSFSGPSDFTKSYGKSVDAHEVLPLFFGGNLQEKPKEHVVGSPLYWVTPQAPPTLCIHGTKDDYVAHEQAVWIVDRLKAAGVDARLRSFEGAGHGLRGDDARTADQEMIAFFNAHLHPPR
jgi:acetyl esterase/lipase